METHTLATYTAKLVEERGVPHVLDVEHSIRVHKPVLSGPSSPASYYIRPPQGMTADELIEWFGAVPGFPEFKLTLVSILGLDTFHQPLISSDDFAKKYFHDNQERIVRVVGKSDSAIASMAAFIGALKRPFDPSQFPNHDDFLVSGYRPAEKGRSIEVKLLYKVANPNQLMKVERLVTVHLDEWNLGREIVTSRHVTRDHAPELILTSADGTPDAASYLDALAKSLPRATQDDVARATDLSRRTTGSSPVPTSQARFTQAQVPTQSLAGANLERAVTAALAEVLKALHFGGSDEVAVVQGGSIIEVKFPRSPSTLWLGTTYREGKHAKELASICVGVKANPLLHEGWWAFCNYDGSRRTLQIRAVATGTKPPEGWKSVPG